MTGGAIMNKKVTDALGIAGIVTLVLGIIFTLMNLFEKTKNQRNLVIALLCVSVSNLCNSLKRFYEDDDCCICECEQE